MSPQTSGSHIYFVQMVTPEVRQQGSSVRTLLQFGIITDYQDQLIHKINLVQFKLIQNGLQNGLKTHGGGEMFPFQFLNLNQDPYMVN